jgi:hypothetical protein
MPLMEVMVCIERSPVTLASDNAMKPSSSLMVMIFTRDGSRISENWKAKAILVREKAERGSSSGGSLAQRIARDRRLLDELRAAMRQAAPQNERF